MSQISDFKGAPIALYGGTPPTSQYNGSATPPVAGTSTDASIASLVGVKWSTTDGRTATLVQNGGTALAQGKVMQSAPQIANTAGLSPATSSTTGYSSAYVIAASIGGFQIQLATSSTAILVNELSGGYLYVVEGTGLGQMVKIASNTAASTTSAIVINTEDPFTVATSTDSRFTLIVNPYGSLNGTDNTTHGIIVTPSTTLTGFAIGVCMYPIAASTTTAPNYGFIQTKGPIAVLGSDTSAVGTEIMVPVSGTAGATAAYAVGSGANPIGTQIIVAASAKYNLVNLKL